MRDGRPLLCTVPVVQLALLLTVFIAAASADVSCDLQLVGRPHAAGLLSARLACHGGTITAAAHPELLGNFTSTFSGVTWSTDGECGQEQEECLLTVCGNSTATFLSATAAGINASVEAARLVCIGGHSNIVWQGANFTNNTARPLTVLGSAVKVTINNSSFTYNAMPGASKGGGAVYIENSTVMVQGSVFVGNKIWYRGGAIYASGSSNLTVASSSFANNSGADSGGSISLHNSSTLNAVNATVRQSSADFGGGLIVFGNTSATLRDCTFLDNVAHKSGGALYATDSARLSLVGGQVRGNQAVSEGGGLALWDHATASITDGTVLADNRAKDVGGAVRMDGASTSMQLVNAELTNNTAERGGAILIKGRGSAVIRACNFTRNKADLGGGSIAAWDNATVDVAACRFAYNRARWAGGVNMGDATRVNITATVFDSNIADDSGGALYAGYTSQLQVDSCVVSNNTATSSHGGGLVANASAVVSISNSNFTGNHAFTWGGVALVNGSARVSAVNISMYGNGAYAGGAIYATGNVTVWLKTVAVLANRAGGDGGAVYSDGNTSIEVRDSAFSFNTAGTADTSGTVSSGGAIAAYDRTRVNLTSSTLSANKATNGGAMRLSHNTTLAAYDAKFLSNVAKSQGGAVIAQVQSSFVMASCILANNTAGGSNGGCFTLLNDARAVLIDACELSGNQAGGSGGCVYMDGLSQMNVSEAVFTDNTAKAGGGAMYISNTSTAMMQGSTITCPGTYGDVAFAGGAIFVDKNGSLSLASCTITNITADHGAGISSYDHASVHIDSCMFTRLSSRNGGGGLLVSGASQAVCTGCVFVQCTADQGGAVYIAETANATIFDTTTSSCAALSQGGGVFVGDQSHLLLSGSTVNACTSSNSTGGGVYVGGNAQATLMATNITNCSSVQQSGGALAVFNNGGVVVRGCSIVGNTAGLWGGGLAATAQSHVQITASDFTSNVCKAKGGAIGMDESATVVVNSSLLHHNSAVEGGAVYLTGNATLRLPLGVRVSNNTASSKGGGFVLDSDGFVADEVRAAAVGNRAPQSANFQVNPELLSFVGSNGTVSNFISRLGSDEGLLHVTLNVSGPQGLPAQAEVAALFNKSLLERVKSGSNGIVHMAPKLRRPPGTYQLLFGVLEFANVPSINLTVHVVNCSAGDVTVSSGDACETCVSGYFSLDPRNTSCDICVPNAVCPGGATMWPMQGFWHSAPSSIQMHRCLNPSACLGGVNNSQLTPGLTDEAYKTAQCAAGYQGNLCGECEIGFGTMKTFVCRKCLPSPTVVGLYALAAVFMLGVVKLLSHCTFSEYTGSTATAADQVKPVDLLKPLVVYAQWLFVVSHLNGVPWPPSLLYPLQAVAWFWSSASATSLGLDCVLPDDSSVPVAVQKVLFGLCMPLAILLILLCIESLLCWLHPQRTARINMRDRLGSLLICIVFLFLPTWTRTVFSLFACVPLDHSAAWPFTAAAVGSYWAEDMSQVCYAESGYHRPFALGVGIFLLLLLCLVLPAWLFAFMWVSKKQGKLNQVGFKKHYGFIYRSWREEVCWWEAVVVLQTIVLVMISTFGFVLGPYYQSLVMTAALCIVGVLLLCVKPHQHAVAGRVWIQGIGALFVTGYSALTFLPYNATQPGLEYSIIMGVVVLLINLAFISSAIWRLLRLVKWAPVKALLCVSLPGLVCRGLAGCCSKAHVKHLPMQSSEIGTGLQQYAFDGISMSRADGKEPRLKYEGASESAGV